MKFRTAYDRGTHEGLICPEVTLTQQNAAEECDINYILSRYERTGSLGDFIKANPQFGDFSDVPSYQESLEIVAKAETQFNQLEGKVRARFENDPAQFLEFVGDPRNANEIEKMGLGTAKKIVNENTPLATGTKESVNAPKVAEKDQNQ